MGGVTKKAKKSAETVPVAAVDASASAERASTGGLTVPVAAVEFSEYVESFKAAFPAEWEELRLQPLQHGLENMVKLLK